MCDEDVRLLGRVEDDLLISKLGAILRGILRFNCSLPRSRALLSVALRLSVLGSR